MRKSRATSVLGFSTAHQVVRGRTLCLTCPDVAGSELRRTVGDFRLAGQQQRVFLPIVEFDNRLNKEVRIRRLGTYLSQRRLRFKTRSPGTALRVQRSRIFRWATMMMVRTLWSKPCA